MARLVFQVEVVELPHRLQPPHSLLAELRVSPEGKLLVPLVYPSDLGPHRHPELDHG